MPNKDKKGPSLSSTGSLPSSVDGNHSSAAPGGGFAGGTGPGGQSSSSSALSPTVERQKASFDGGSRGRGSATGRGGNGGTTGPAGDDSPGRVSVGSGGSDNREMVGGCCVCSDERGWDENPLVYCDGQGCNVAVHQACYGIVSVPQGPWFCRKCETTERAVRVRCELCPSKEGALKRTDTNSWAHVVCALYIPEVRFGNVSTMEPIVLGLVPQERYLKTCYLCESQGRESRASTGACMQCNRSGCKQSFHVTCAQSAGLLCEEAGNYMDNVKYCGYCQYHYQKINKKVVKTIPAFKPIKAHANRDSASPESSPEKSLRSAGGGGSGDHAKAFQGSYSSSAGSMGTNNSSGFSAGAHSGGPNSGCNSGSGGNGSNSAGSGSGSGAFVSGSGSGSLAHSGFRERESGRAGGDSSASKKNKKGRKPNGGPGSGGSGGSSSEVKIEAPKFVVETSSSGHHHHSNASSSSTSMGIGSRQAEDGREGGSASSSSSFPSSAKAPSASSQLPPWPSSTLSSKRAEESSANNSKTESKEFDKESNSSSSNEKPPVVLKFGKQDNGTYYKKDVAPSSSSSSSMPSASSSSSSLSSSTANRKDHHRDKNHHHHHHHKKDKARRQDSNQQEAPMEADTTSSTNSSSSSSTHHHYHHSHGQGHHDSGGKTSTSTSNSSVSVTLADPAATSSGVPSSSSSSNDVVMSAAPESSSASTGTSGKEGPRMNQVGTDNGKKEYGGGSVKVEPMEVDMKQDRPRDKNSSPAVPAPPSRSNSSSDLVISAIKTSCTVSLDKSKVDLKLLRKSDFKRSDGGSVAPPERDGCAGSMSAGLNSGVQLTALPKSEPGTEEKHKTLSSTDFAAKGEKAEADTSSKSGVTITAEKASSSEQTSPGEMASAAAHSKPSSGESGSSLGPAAKAAGVTSGMPSAASGGSVTIEQVSPAKDDQLIISPTTGKMPRMSASGKRIGRPPKKGTHVAANSLPGLRPGSPSGAEGAGDAMKRKRKSPNKRNVNGSDNAPWMLGATLNPSSAMAKEMNMALEDEIKVHAAGYDPNKDKQYLGVPLPGRRRRSTSSQAPHNASDILSSGKSQPQTLEELLERQWEQGSQFLMEQASHFDIASLLSSLHQLKEENVDLEDSVDRLVQRRDHLLAVRARLLALSSLSLSSSPPTPERPHQAAPGQQNGPSPSSAAQGGGRGSAHVSPRNSTAATVSPISIQRAGARSSSAEMVPLPSPRAMHHQPPGPPGPPHHSSGLPPGAAARDQPPMSSRGPPQLPSPRDSRNSPRGPPSGGIENGLDYPSQHHQHMAMSGHHHQQQQQHAAAVAIQHQRGRDPPGASVNDRIMPAHLLTVVSSASGMPPTSRAGVPPGAALHPPPRQSAYPPVSVTGGPPHPPPGGMAAPPPGSARGGPSIPHSMPQHGMVRGPPPPQMGHGGPPGAGHHYGGGGPPPPAGSGGHPGYQIVSPPPSHPSMVTLDRSSQQHLRGPPTSQPPPPQQQHVMRMDKR